MKFVKKAVDGVKAPVESVKRNPWALLGFLILIVLAFRFRGQIMGFLSKLGPIGTGARKLSGEA